MKPGPVKDAAKRLHERYKERKKTAVLFIGNEFLKRIKMRINK
jgi:hypothetical protein